MAATSDMHTELDLHQLVAAVGDAVVAANAASRITLWNPAAERIFGYTEGDALGQPLELIIPERLRRRHTEGYDKTMETGITKYGTSLLRVPALHKDGRQLSIAFTVAMLFTPEHKVSSIVAVIRDETTRFEEERTLKKRLAELEARLAAAP